MIIEKYVYSWKFCVKIHAEFVLKKNSDKHLALNMKHIIHFIQNDSFAPTPIPIVKFETNSS